MFKSVTRIIQFRCFTGFKVKHKALQLSTEEPGNQLVAPLIVDGANP